MSVAEGELWSRLRLTDLHMRRQAPIGRFVADFASHAAKLVIEVDGPHHEAPDRTQRDAQRDRWLESQGYVVVRVSEADARLHPERITASIVARVASPPSPALPPSRGKGEPSLTPEEVAFVRSLVIVQDDLILALDKPAGLSSQGGRGQTNTLDELLFAFRRSNGNRPRLVHRLDRDTSGVILAAKTKPAAAFLGKALMARSVRKTYLALVPPGGAGSGVIDAPLRREEQGREAYTRVAAPDHPDAEPALTRFRTLAQGPAGALLEVRPETGRMHQIRVHLASIGRPLLGDVRYGGALTAGGEAVPRLMLHAVAIDVPHPAGGRRRYQAPPPADMAAVARACGIDLAAALAGVLQGTAISAQG